MTTKLYKKETRGTADFGWLKANFSFSFGNYFNPERIQFGALRVLNDDTIAGGMGFGMHPHNNMEIITIPLEGGVLHTDSMGNKGVVAAGEVQVMSAGTGIQHSEFNNSQTADLKLLQIWIFPVTENVKPRYDQKKYDLYTHQNKFVPIICPMGERSETAIEIHQQAHFNLGLFDGDTAVNYQLKDKSNGVFLFLIDGEIEVDNQFLKSRDAMEITVCEVIDIKIKNQSKLLVIEVPLNL